MNLKTMQVLLGLVCLGLLRPGPPGFCADPAAARTYARLGMNLSAPADWNTELPFVDVFRLSRPWVSRCREPSRNPLPAPTLDPNGWVRQLAPGCWAETRLCSIAGGHYPAGLYTVLYQGRGRLDFENIAAVVSRTPGRIVIRIDPVRSEGGFALKILQTQAQDPVRDIRVVMPGFGDTYSGNPWHPLFLQRWHGVACFRFMDWMKTNGATAGRWPERPTPAVATFAAQGVPLELMIDLCNRQQADAWFCMPHQADDDYVRRFAQTVRRLLNPGLKVYVEYSNEVWNPAFPQHKYARAKALELGLGPPQRPWEGAGMYYARRAVEIFRIWEAVFEQARPRLVRVIAWQAGSTWWLDNIIFKDARVRGHVDALAVAPYLSMIVSAQGKGLLAATVASWNPDQVLDYLETRALPQAIEAMRASQQAAQRLGLSLLAYEGGQHMAAINGAENNTALMSLFQAANAHPRLAAIYEKYYANWTRIGGGLFCYFSSIAKWNKWGSWGIMQHYDDDPARAPKMAATLQWGRRPGPQASGF